MGTSKQAFCRREPAVKVKAGAWGLPNMAPEPRDEKRAVTSVGGQRRATVRVPARVFACVPSL